ncbi:MULTISPECIES: EndoU domain-containing protein [unclassified Agarivorans]|uniref:EndoU domain-containing protein n=1 Tax=unclassified Agarivorans TaxID=2636026 RepID=UPI003D7DEFE6
MGLCKEDGAPLVAGLPLLAPAAQPLASTGSQVLGQYATRQAANQAVYAVAERSLLASLIPKTPWALLFYSAEVGAGSDDVAGFIQQQAQQDELGHRTWLANGGDGSIEEWKSRGKPSELVDSVSDKSVDLNAIATRDVGNVTAPIDFDGHILSGEVKPNGNVVGGYSTATGNVRVIPGTESQPNAQGVYTAQIEVPDPSSPGDFLPKTNNGGISTMFPDSWSADRIKVEVDAAYQNKVVTGNKWSGVTPRR